MKRFLSILMTLMLICGLAFPMLTASAYAKPMASVSASPSTAIVGKNVVVTVKHSASDGKIGALDYQISYNSKVLEYVSSEGDAVVNGAGGALAASWYNFKGEASVTVKLVFKTLAAGKADVSVKTTTFADETAAVYPLPSDAATTVTVLNEAPKNTNANLKAVDVVANDSNGKKLTAKLSPAFSAGVVSYTVSVPHNTNSVSINSEVADTKASSKIEGSWAVVAGDWIRKVVVTAEDGVTQKTYSFKIVREKAPSESTPSTSTPTPPTSSTPEAEDDLRVIIDSKEYSVVTDTTEITVPAGFKKEITKYNGIDIPSFMSKDSKLTLVCLSDSEGKTSFFSYDAQKIKFLPCEFSSIGAGNYILLDAADYTDKVKGLISQEVTVAGKKLNGYRFSGSGEFLLVWAIGADGEGKLYVYDTAGKTLQRYAGVHQQINSDSTSSNDDKPANTPNDDVLPIQDIDFIMVVIIALVVIILVLLVAWIAALTRLKRAYPPKTDEVAFVPFFEDNSFEIFEAEAETEETAETKETAETEETEE